MHKLSKALTFMGALLALAFCAVSCKTDDDDEPTMYTVTVSDSLEHGKVTADKSSAEAGATVKLTATADSGYELDSYSVKDASANELEVTDDTFTMPKSDVTVSATFKETTVTPQKTAGSISYATTTVSKTTADEAFTNTLTNTGDGTVTYASSKETVATVNEDGEVTIKGAGETTITATVADSDTYTYATKTASYTLTVTQAPPLNLNLKTGRDINAILNGFGTLNVTQFKKSAATTPGASQYLDLSEEIPVWLDGTTVYYYIPDGRTVYMNADSSEMFSDCYKLTSLDLGSFNTSNVTNMSYMFSYCSELTSLDLGSFDTGNVTDMNGMFMGCSALTNLNLSSFDTGSVTNMDNMFGYCFKLTNLNLSSFNTSNVTNMYCMFAGCSKLTSLDVTGFDTSKVTNMSYMFYCCPELTSLDLSSFYTSNVTNMSNMFSGCEGLTSLDLSKFDTGNVTYMSNMFSGCKGLKTIYATDKFVTTSVTSDDYCFDQCSKLVGGSGTTYDENNIYVTYARIDGGPDSASPGYFTLKPIGSKSKPDAVGDIVFSDGSAVPYSTDLTLTEEQKAAAIAVIFDADKKLGVGLVQGTNLSWAKNGTPGYNMKETLSAKKTNGNSAVDAEFSGAGANDGSESLTKFRTAVGVNSSDKLDSDNYPAWAWIEDYATNASLAGTSYKSGWYMPSIKELCDLYNAKDTVNDSIQKTGGTQMPTNWFWSSSQFESYGSIAWVVSFGDGALSLSHLKYEAGSVCAVRAFN